MTRELQDVANGGAAEAVEGLVLVPDHAEVAVRCGQAREELLLDVVGVLVLVHHDIADPVDDGRTCLGIDEQVEEEFLLVGKVDAVGCEELVHVSLVSLPNSLDKWIC